MESDDYDDVTDSRIKVSPPSALKENVPNEHSEQMQPSNESYLFCNANDEVITNQNVVMNKTLQNTNSPMVEYTGEVVNPNSENSSSSNGDEGYIESSNSNEELVRNQFIDEEGTSSESDDLCNGSSTESDVDIKDDFSSPLKLTEITDLPDTVTVLDTPHGSKVYLVGTAHFSLESQEDVAKTIQATQPHIVMVELCKSRVNILSLDETTILEESKNMNFEKVQIAIKQNGFVRGIMYLLLLSMSAHITKQLGMAPGGEFRRAFTEAKKVPGCLVHLGDRPIHITLQRALASLSWWQKLRLAWYMLTNKEPISKEEVERFKQRDLLEEMLAEMTGEFPALSQVFVHERDIYLAYSLKLAATPIPSSSSPNGLLPAVVVGVVGIGHMPGIISNWNNVTDADIPPILKVPESSLTSRVLQRTFRISLIGLAVWSCYRYLSPRRSIEWLSQWIIH